MRELPAEERPREKMLREGARALSSGELLALLIGSGSSGGSALRVAERLLALHPDGLRHLAESGAEELLCVEGIGPARACSLMAALELGRRLSVSPKRERIRVDRPSEVAALFSERMRYLRKEEFQVLLLNQKNEILLTEQVSVGDLSSAITHPREIFSGAVRRSAAAVILAHNHPSGDPAPSENDLRVTARLVEAGKLLGIEVLDHIIIGDGSFTSLRERGYI